MPNRNLDYAQSALDAFTAADSALNELNYYSSDLKSPNHSYELCQKAIEYIQNLTTMQEKIVQNILYYANMYAYLDDDNAENGDYCADYGFSYTEGKEHEKSFWEKTWNQILQGDFSEDSTWLGTGVSVALGFLGIDFLMDIRDTAANVSKGDWGMAALCAIGLIPVVGGIKSIKYADDVLGIGSKTVRGVSGAKELSMGTKILKTTLSGNTFLFHDNMFTSLTKSEDGITITNANLIESFTYRKELESIYNEKRKEFESSIRSEFIKHIANDSAESLRVIGFSEEAITIMRNTGRLPVNSKYEVHHKIPLATDEGTNNFDNLILIDSQSHRIFSNYQTSMTKHLMNEQTVIIDWVVPNGEIYIP